MVTYFKGDAAEYTGRVVVVAGGTFYEVKMLEGVSVGLFKVVKNPPVAQSGVNADGPNHETKRS